jgi:hypothetical protein
MASRRWRDLWTALRPILPLALATSLIAWISVHAILARTGGEPAVPLDDTFIHFQYARSFARLHPLAYTVGALPAPGATSLLYPIVLCPFLWLGFTGTRLIWVAWTLGYVSFALLALETYRLSLGLLRRELSVATGAMVLVFGGLVWCAGSGMEVVPFAWLLVRSLRLSADWYEAGGDPASRKERVLLLVFPLLCVTMRPEGVLACAGVAAAILLRPRGGSRAFALAPLAAPLLTPLFDYAATGQATSTTALVKWLPLSPYLHGARLFQAIWANVELLFGTLLDGRIWSAIFVPAGGRVIAFVALPALLAWSLREKRSFRGAMALLVALGMLIPTTYDSFLWNRLRYLWPFAPGWFIALGALAEWAGALAERWNRSAGFVRLLVAGLFVGSFATGLSRVVDDLAESSDAIRRQQTALGRWAKETLPPDAVIGVNDTGAIAYFSDRRVFDVVGLTTRYEARYWAAGAGSRFEHYEHTPEGDLPTHFIVYPEWMGMPPVLGKLLAERTVHASILGGTTMAVYTLDNSTFQSAEQPLEAAHGLVSDAVDVADLDSEHRHRFELFWATQSENRVFEKFVKGKDRADGGRLARTLDRFWLDLHPDDTFVARLQARKDVKLEVLADGRVLGEPTLEGGAEWHEIALPVPKDFVGYRRIEVLAESGKDFASLNYFAIRHDPEDDWVR